MGCGLRVTDDVQELLSDQIFLSNVFLVRMELVISQRVDFRNLAAPEFDAVHVQAFCFSVAVQVGCCYVAHFVGIEQLA